MLSVIYIEQDLKINKRKSNIRDDSTKRKKYLDLRLSYIYLAIQFIFSLLNFSLLFLQCSFKASDPQY